MCVNQQKERELYMNKNGFEDRSEDRRVLQEQEGAGGGADSPAGQKDHHRDHRHRADRGGGHPPGHLLQPLQGHDGFKNSDRPRHRRPADRAAQLCAGKRS